LTEHWWKVVRPGINRPFFVPAQYVTEVGEESDEDVFQDQKKKENGGKSLATKAHSLSLPDGNSNANNKRNSFNGGGGGSSQETVLKGKPESSKSKSKESSFFSFSKSNKINRNEGSRASHREKGQSHSKPSSKISSSSGKLKNWSASLEELSKQIVFPGLASESVADLTFATTSFRGNGGERENCGSSGLRDNEQEDTTSFGRERSSFSSFQCDNKNQNQHSKSINKCLTFRNPAFSKGSAESTSEEKLEIGNSNHDITEVSLPQEETRSASVSGIFYAY
jgi:hypothetical protein